MGQDDSADADSTPGGESHGREGEPDEAPHHPLVDGPYERRRRGGGSGASGDGADGHPLTGGRFAGEDGSTVERPSPAPAQSRGGPGPHDAAEDSWRDQKVHVAGIPVSPGEPTSDDETEPPWLVDLLAQVGVYLALAGAVLAGVGLVLAWLGVQPYGNASTFFGLLFVTVAMVFGIVFQAYRSDFSLTSG